MSEKAPGNSPQKDNPGEKSNSKYWNGHEEHFSHTLGGTEIPQKEAPAKMPASGPKKKKEAFGVGLEGDGIVPKKEKSPVGPREMVEGDLGLVDGKIEVKKDPSGEKKIRSFLKEAMKDPEVIKLREAAATAALAFDTQEGGWRYAARKISGGMIGGKKLEQAKVAAQAAKKAWSDKVGEKMKDAYTMAEARVQETVGTVDDKQAKKFANLGGKSVLNRYRGIMAHAMVTGEMQTFKSRKAELGKAQEDAASPFTKAAKRALAWYSGQPRWKKVLYSSSLITLGATGLGVAGAGVGAIAGFGAWRAVRAASGVYLGVSGGEVVAAGSEKLSRNKSRKVAREEDMKAVKAAGAKNFKAAKGAGGAKEGADLMQSFVEKADKDETARKADRRRRNLIKGVSAAAIGGGVFAGLEYAAGGGAGVTETSKGRSGIAPSTEPGVPPQPYPIEAPPIFGKDILGHAEEELELKQTAPADIVGPGIVGPEGIQGDDDFSNDPRNPYRGYGKNGFGVPATPEEVARKAWIEGGMVQDDATGVDNRIAAPGEQDNVTGVDNATRQHWNYTGGPQIAGHAGADLYPKDPLADGSAPRPVSVGDFGGEVVAAPGEQDNVTGVDNAKRQNWDFNGGPRPSASVEDTNKAILQGQEGPRGRSGIAAVAEPHVAKPLFAGEVTVKSGDNLSFIIKDALTRSEHMSGLSAAQQDVLVGKYVAHLKTLGTEELTRMGIKNPSNLNLIQPGDKFDLRVLNEENLYGKFVGEIKTGIPAKVGTAPTAPQAPETPSVPASASAADIQTLSTKILSDQVRDIFSTRAFFLGPRTSGMTEFNRISWQRADTFVGDPTPGLDPTLDGNKAEALRGILRQAQSSGLNLKNLSIRAALEKASELEATRILTEGR